MAQLTDGKPHMSANANHFPTDFGSEAVLGPLARRKSEMFTEYRDVSDSELQSGAVRLTCHISRCRLRRLFAGGPIERHRLLNSQPRLGMRILSKQTRRPSRLDPRMGLRVLHKRCLLVMKPNQRHSFGFPSRTIFWLPFVLLSTRLQPVLNRVAVSLLLIVSTRKRSRSHPSKPTNCRRTRSCRKDYRWNR